MQETSQLYRDGIKAPVRRLVCRVQIDYSDPFVDQSIEINASENNYTSYPFQVADAIHQPSHKYLSLDGSWTLGNQGFSLAPSAEEARDVQYGWWGSTLSGSDGRFKQPYPTLSASFFPRPVRSLKVVGDLVREEWPVDFTVNVYSNGTLLHQESVTGNSSIVWEKTIDNIGEVTRMELIITRWSHSNRVAKVLEFFTSIQETYYEDDVEYIHLLEEREVTQGSLPVGNISSNEIDIQLTNINRKFDPGNKESSLYGLIKANRRIKAWLGLVLEDNTVEYIPLGVFWTTLWDVPEQQTYAITTGRDRLDQLRDTGYLTSQVSTNKSLYDMASDVLIDSGLRQAEYWIDPELKDITIPYAYFSPQSHREALRKIAEAGLGQVYCNREGIIRVEGPSFTLNRIKEAEETVFIQGPNFPAETTVINAYGISLDHYEKKDNPNRQYQLANIIEVETQPLVPMSSSEIFRHNESIAITANQSKEINISFNHTPCIDVTLSLSGTGSIIEQEIFAWGARVVVTSATTGSFIIVANGRQLVVANKETVVKSDRASIIDNGPKKFTFPNNPLVQSVSTAEKIAERLLDYYKEPYSDLTLEWIGDPSLELGDLITVADNIGNQTISTGYYYITKQTLTYSGSLDASLEGRRARIGS